MSVEKRHWNVLRVETLIWGALFCVGALVAMVYVLSWGGTPHFFQEHFVQSIG